jgi:hypothetical protein
MRVMLRLPLLTGVLLLAGAQFALAESPLPDPVAPAVIGRPLDQIGPAKKPAAKKAAAARPSKSRQAAARAAAATKVAREPAATTRVMGAAAAQAPAAAPRLAKQAADDRVDPRMPASEAGKGRNLARKPLAPGAYIADRHRTAVRKYYEKHAAPGAPANWRIGEPVPEGVPLAAVPKGLLASLPPLPPGHRYVQLGGEVVLIGAQSKMVVDGVSRPAR